MPVPLAYVGAFFVGVIGALVIVWLRWVGSLPRFSSSIEIAGCEEEYECLSTAMTRKVKDDTDLSQPEVQHSDSLRKDIWKQRWATFGVSALLYATLGGATALLFVGIGVQDITDPLTIGRLLTAGALWTGFYSFIDVRKADDVADIKRREWAKEANKDAEELKRYYEKRIKNLTESANKTITRLVAEYDAIVLEHDKGRLK